MKKQYIIMAKDEPYVRDPEEEGRWIPKKSLNQEQKSKLLDMILSKQLEHQLKEQIEKLKKDERIKSNMSSHLKEQLGFYDEN